MPCSRSFPQAAKVIDGDGTYRKPGIDTTEYNSRVDRAATFGSPEASSGPRSISILSRTASFALNTLGLKSGGSDEGFPEASR